MTELTQNNKFIPKDAEYLDKEKTGNTHQFLSRRGRSILNFNKGDLRKVGKFTDEMEKNLQLLYKYEEASMEGSIAPDYGANGRKKFRDSMTFSIYQDHFLNPFTMRNFTYEKDWYLSYKIDETAESQARNFMARAKAKWLDGEIEYATYLLFKACHFIEDSGEPHHASNVTGGGFKKVGTAHTRFELYMEDEKEKYALESVRDMSLYNLYEEDNFNDFVSKMVIRQAKLSNPIVKKALLNNTGEEWDEAGEICLKNVQETVAVVLRRFLEEVSHPKEQKIVDPIGKFHCSITVADEKDAGTDNVIKVCFDMKNGETHVFTCDVAGDDFQRGINFAYQFEIGKDSPIKYNEIDRIYLKKFSGGLAEDQMKLEEVELYIQGQRVGRNVANCWMKNGDIVTIKKFK